MAITISGSGITSANIADGTIVNADVADVAASKLTGALPAIDGAALTNLPGGGKVLQVVGNATTSQSSTSSTSWADVPNFSQSITLSSSSSRVMVLIDGTFGHVESRQQFNIALYRDGTKIHSSDLIKSFGGQGYTSGNGEPSGIMVIDNPATTSTITYKLKWQSLQGQPMYFNRGQSASQDFTSSITLMEIGA